MINCGSCGAELVNGSGVYTSALASVTQNIDWFGARGDEYECGCGGKGVPGFVIEAPKPESKPEPKQVEPEETIQGQLAGVREFKVTEDGSLGSLVHGDVWEPDKPHRATCAKGEAIGLGSPGSYAIRVSSWDDHSAPRKLHDAPDYNCQCGFYSFHSLEEADKAGDGFQFPHRIRAVVSAWGNVIICEHGFRAEWMQIEAIIKQPTFAWGAEIDATAAWDKIAARYSVPVIEMSEVAEFCEALGTVVDGLEERARAKIEADRRRQKIMSSRTELSKSVREVLEARDVPKSKPAFWRDRQQNKKKGWDTNA